MFQDSDKSRSLGTKQLLEEYLTKSLDSLKSKEEQIHFLKSELIAARKDVLPMQSISKEAVFIDPNIQELSIQKTIFYNTEGAPTDTVEMAHAKFAKQPARADIDRLQNWLKTRCESDSVKVLIDL